MASLEEVLDVDLLSRMLAEGYVSKQLHPSEPLAVLNYTHAAQHDRVWNDVTRACRGLIYDLKTREVMARPWPKFFNYGEVVEDARFENHLRLDLDAPVTVRDKLDGSLGILYPTSRGYAVSTRGSFTSEQALHATDVWRRLYAETFSPVPGLTYLLEIIYPANRIVVDYAGQDDLFFLGAVETETGKPTGRYVWWPGPRAEHVGCETLAEALALEPRTNAEGVVVTFWDTGLMLKVKQEDYVALHRIVTGLNERTVWEHLGAGGKIDDLCEPLPREFHAWINKVADGLILKASTIQSEAEYVFGEVVKGVSLCGSRDWTRKEFAEKAREEENPSLLFLLLDGRDTWPAIWRTLRPKRPRTMVDEAADS